MKGEEAIEEMFEASKCWFMMFEERNHPLNINVQDEAASAYVEAAIGYQDNS